MKEREKKRNYVSIYSSIAATVLSEERLMNKFGSQLSHVMLHEGNGGGSDEAGAAGELEINATGTSSRALLKTPSRWFTVAI